MGLKRTAAHPSAMAPLCPPPRCLRLSHLHPNPRLAVDPSPIAEELTPAGQPSGRRCGQPLPHPRRLALWWPQYRRQALLKLCGTRLLSATRPSKLINGCQGHPLFCLSPGTTQRQRNPEEKRMNAQSLYSVGICRQSRYAV